MRGRLSTELRVFSELARAVSEPYSQKAILDRVCFELQRAFGFERVQARVGEATPEPRQREASLQEREGRPVVTIPLLADEQDIGEIVCEGRVEAVELEILTAVGRVTALSIHNARHVDELRRLDQAKSDFISIASHELRSPIAVVHGVAATLHLRGDELRPGQARRLHATLFGQTTRVTELVDRLLDLSQLEAGSLTLKPERFRPRDRIEALLPNIVPDRLHDVRVEIASELELFTDPHAVERVVANLVVNALRHGEPPVCVRGRANDGVELVVEDAGLGVDPDFVPRLFERFSRSTPSRAMGSYGAGLGLSIAHSYAAAIGADLRYEPIDPTGARFSLAFPAGALAFTAEGHAAPLEQPPGAPTA